MNLLSATRSRAAGSVTRTVVPWPSVLSIAAVGLNILTGYAGQLSLGTGGFMAVGAYAAFAAAADGAACDPISNSPRS